MHRAVYLLTARVNGKLHRQHGMGDGWGRGGRSHLPASLSVAATCMRLLPTVAFSQISML